MLYFGRGWCMTSISHLIVFLFIQFLSYLSEHTISVLMKITCIHHQIFIYIHSLLLQSFNDHYSNRLYLALLLLLPVVWPITSEYSPVWCKWGNSRTTRYFTALPQNLLKLKDSMNSHSLWQQARDKTQYVLRNGSRNT